MNNKFRLIVDWCDGKKAVNLVFPREINDPRPPGNPSNRVRTGVKGHSHSGSKLPVVAIHR